MAALCAIVLFWAAGCATTGRTRGADGGEPGAWTATQRTLASGLVIANLVDYGQTRQAISDGGYEANPLLGRTPSSGRLLATKLVVLGGILWFADRHPERRTAILAMNVGLQVIVVARNATVVGVRLRF